MVRKFFIFILNTIFVSLIVGNAGVCAATDDFIEETFSKTDNYEDFKKENFEKGDITDNKEWNNTIQNSAPQNNDIKQNNLATINNGAVQNNTRIKRSEYKSVMFSKKNIDDIFKLIPKLGKDVGGGVIDNFSFENNNEKQLIDENNIAIYLNSIMYMSKDNWVVWLNGNRITNLNNGDGEVVITAISPLEASFTWTIDNARWDIINTNKNIPQERYKLVNNSVEIYFSLSPNQTFIPILNKVIEGKVKVEEPEEKNNNNPNNINNKGVNNLNNNSNNRNNPNDFSKQDNLFF